MNPVITNILMTSTVDKPLLIRLFEEFVRYLNDVAYIIKLVFTFARRVWDYLAWVPTEVYTILTSIFLVVVIYKVLGREG